MFNMYFQSFLTHVFFSEKHMSINLTCSRPTSFVSQRANGAEQCRSGHVTVEVEFGASIITVLNHTHPGLVFAHLKGSGHRRHQATHQLEVGAAHTPGAIQ